MNSIYQIILILFFPLTCLIIILINRKKNKRNSISIPTAPKENKGTINNSKFPKGFYIFIAIIIILFSAFLFIPGIISMRERAWSYTQLPKIFSDISIKYVPNNKPIVLNYKYIVKLHDQYYNLYKVFSRDQAKDKIISILSYVLETELPKSGENIDTTALFDRINKVINDTLSTHNIK